MKKIFLGLGGNVGDVAATLKEVERRLHMSQDVHNLQFSKLYRTSPVSDIPQEDFINCACAFYTTLSPRKLLEATQEIETRLGKMKKAKNAPRPIDIDILSYGDDVITDAELQIPHPRWQERLFVLIPLLELTKKIGGVDIALRIEELKKTTTDKVEEFIVEEVMV